MKIIWFYGINNNLQQYTLLVSCSIIFISLSFNNNMVTPLQHFFIHFIFKKKNKFGPISVIMHYVSWFLLQKVVHISNQQFKLRENNFLQKLTFFFNNYGKLQFLQLLLQQPVFVVANFSRGSFGINIERDWSRNKKF